MTLTSSNLFSALPVIHVKVGAPLLPNLVGEALVATYKERVNDYPLYRQGLDLSLQDTIDTLQPDVQRNLPHQKPDFIPAAGVLGAHYKYIASLKWALDAFNKANRAYYEEARIQPLVGGVATGESTFFLFAKHIEKANLEHIQIPQHQDDNWALRPDHLKTAIAAAQHNGVFPLGFTSISPDAPVHNIRDRDTARGIYQALQSFNDERMAWLVRQSGGQERFDKLRKSNADFADAISILTRPKLFDDLVYLPTEVGTKRTCLFAELHDEMPHIVDDIVTGISLSKIGLAGLRCGAVFVFNKALAKQIKEVLDISVEGLVYSSYAPLALLDKSHPLNAAFRQSILDYRDDIYQRAVYFSALFQSGHMGRVLLRALPKLNRLLGHATDPLTHEPLSFGAIQGVELLPREAAGYFTNIHIDTKIWAPVLDAAFPTRRADGMSDIEAMHRLLPAELKIMVMPISLKDRDGKPMAVFRMNGHTEFENLTGVYARLRHTADVFGLTPASTRQLKIIPVSTPARPPLLQDNAAPKAATGKGGPATDVA